jgi:hypothetical protein
VGAIRRATFWLGHYFAPIFYGSTAVLGTIWYKPPPPWLVVIPYIVLVLSGTFAMAYHENDFRCKHCFAAVPFLDPQGAVDRRRRELRLYHRRGLYVGLQVVSLIVGVVIPPSIFGYAWWFLGVRVFTFAVIGGYMTWVTITHNRLRPWCPHCPRWGGDDDPAPREPDPVTPPGVKVDKPVTA